MGTNASWETAASFFSVRQDIEDIRLVHCMQQPLLKRPSFATLHYCSSQDLLFILPLPLPLNFATDSTQLNLVFSVFDLLPELAD
jgi:hypothetical protein